jgi:hypothetical protein
MHFVVALDVRRALCCVRVREELASAAERATSFVLGRPARRPLLRRPNAKLPAAFAMHDDCSLDARSLALARRTSPETHQTVAEHPFKLVLVLLLSFQLAPHQVHTHTYSLPVSVCLRVCGIFLTECHVYLRVTSARRVSCVVTHCTLYQHAHKGVVAQRNYCLLMS